MTAALSVDILVGMMEVREDDDAHGMDYGDYLERLNLTLKAMVALQDQVDVGDTSQYLARRFDEPMLSDILKMLQRVETVLTLAAEASE